MGSFNSFHYFKKCCEVKGNLAFTIEIKENYLVQLRDIIVKKYSNFEEERILKFPKYVIDTFIGDFTRCNEVVSELMVSKIKN